MKRREGEPRRVPRGRLPKSFRCGCSRQAGDLSIPDPEVGTTFSEAPTKMDLSIHLVQYLWTLPMRGGFTGPATP